MNSPPDDRRVTAIVPAYNEADRIGAVLEVLTRYPGFAEVIVVDDGSTDGTGDVVRRFPVRHVRNESKRGKGHAMDRAVGLAHTDIVFFCDADVSGLNHDIIDAIIGPVVAGEVDMFIGMRNRKWYIVSQVITLVPLLGGERALTRALWRKVPDYYKQYFRTEAALNFYALWYGRGFQYKVFRGLSQVIKEKKYGLLDGTRQRWAMMYNILSAQWRLHLVDGPEPVRKGWLLAILSLHSVVGMVIGALFLVAVHYGPTRFVRALFAGELVEDPGDLLANFLLHLSSTTTAGTIATIGFLIFLPNAVTFLFTVRKLGYLLHGLTYKFRNNRS